MKMGNEELLQKRKEKFLTLQCRYMALSCAFWDVLSEEELKRKMVKELGRKFMELAEQILDLND